ncbi:phosphotransferase family protein [Vibrio gallaecicus]|uniref:Phosphotransferase family protein n=1 Tax=Vibrio gallaecicus TaxID=552386 RepID=A0ABV4N671_9VIBR
MDNDRRNPILPLDEESLSEFLEGRTLVSSSLFPLGKCNSNYKLTLSDGTVVVARVSNSGPNSKELRVMELAQQCVKVPKVLYENAAIVVLEFLNGRNLESVPEYSRLAGVAIAQLSSVTFDASGSIEEDGSISAFDFGGVQGFIHSSLENAGLAKRLGVERKEKLLTLLCNKAQLLEELDSHTCFVHGDFNPTNILIHEGHLSGVLDWEFALAGTPYMDIGNLLRNTPQSFHSEIENGLREGGMDLPSDWKERAELVDLTSQLEFLMSSRSEEFKLTCIQRIDNVIEQYGESF